MGIAWPQRNRDGAHSFPPCVTCSLSVSYLLSNTCVQSSGEYLFDFRPHGWPCEMGFKKMRALRDSVPRRRSCQARPLPPGHRRCPRPILRGSLVPPRLAWHWNGREPWRMPGTLGRRLGPRRVHSQVGARGEGTWRGGYSPPRPPCVPQMPFGEHVRGGISLDVAEGAQDLDVAAGQLWPYDSAVALVLPCQTFALAHVRRQHGSEPSADMRLLARDVRAFLRV